MFDAQQLRRYVVTPALEALSMAGAPAENLVLLTWAVESRLGTYLQQVGGGPAMGPCQMEPATHRDIWANYLRYRKPLADTVQRLAPPVLWSQDVDEPVEPEALQASLWYAAAMTRIHYRRFPESLPAATDWAGMAELWKRRYNGPGKGTVEHALAAVAACGLLRAS